MGRPLGAYSSDELDRPDLNKCPDCGCFFATECCPLCGKPCPEEMRSGNRKPVKALKRRQNNTGRVTFVEWYHSWWFIILMLIFMPLIGIVLLITSPNKKWVKALIIVVAVLYAILSTFGIGTVLQWFRFFENPVDTSLSREEYIAACEEMSLEGFYRSADSLQGKFLTVTLTVEECIIDVEECGKYDTYYLCHDGNGSNFIVMIRDCIQDTPQNLLPGDRITVYGEGAGAQTVYDTYYTPHTAPCIYVAYIVIE